MKNVFDFLDLGPRMEFDLSLLARCHLKTNLSIYTVGVIRQVTKQFN